MATERMLVESSVALGAGMTDIISSDFLMEGSAGATADAWKASVVQPADEDVEPEKLMDSRMYMEATERMLVESSVALGAGMTDIISSDFLMEGSAGATADAWKASVVYPADEDEDGDGDVEPEKLMDSRMYMEAIQGHVDGFIQILRSISSERELQHEELLSQVSPGNNTCLHIAVTFGHHELAKYIVGRRADLIEKKNSQGDTALHISARKGDLPFVKFAMESCPSGSAASRDVEKAENSLLRMVNNEENTVLHEALIHNCKQEKALVEILIRKDPQVAYYPNKEGKSPLYLAAEAHYFDVVDAIGESEVEERIKNGDRKAKPAVHGAIMGKNKAMLEKILAMNLVQQKDEYGRTPLHFAASIGYLEGVQTLLRQSKFDRYQTDSDGLYPIHVAAKRGYVDIVKELLQSSPDSKELLIKHDRENFLHVAAKYGQDNVVNFVLKEERLENLINEKNSYGNTPLHLATMRAHAKVVCSLTWDKRVDVKLVNNKGQTAFDIAATVKHPPSLRQRLTWMALKSAGAKPARESNVPPSGSAGAQPPQESKVPPIGKPKPSNPPDTNEFKDMVSTLVLVSTLVATVTYAAGFTMPGGNNSSGMAKMLTRNMFHVFVICDTIAMYSAILAAIALVWAQFGDSFLFGFALKCALPLLALAFTAMSLGFTAGVYLVVSNLPWLAIIVLIIGIISLVSLVVPFSLLFLPLESTNRILRYIFYYPFRMLIWASGAGSKQED